MKTIQITTTVTVDENGEIVSQAVAGIRNAEDSEWHIESDEDETERHVVVSDLANVCEYLDDSEIIKIRLMIQKAEARKERTENG